jgi:hypothetical protein
VAAGEAEDGEGGLLLRRLLRLLLGQGGRAASLSAAALSTLPLLLLLLLLILLQRLLVAGVPAVVVPALAPGRREAAHFSGVVLLVCFIPVISRGSRGLSRSAAAGEARLLGRREVFSSKGTEADVTFLLRGGVRAGAGLLVVVVGRRLRARKRKG